ncbi:MAG: hypothetical protein OEQ53_14010, partial [Saprospiraceae bacterium]|nr:hypothetical protein [Saprospiraceae bacterium]
MKKFYKDASAVVNDTVPSGLFFSFGIIALLIVSAMLPSKPSKMDTERLSENLSISLLDGGDFSDMDFEAGDPDLYPRIIFSDLTDIPVGRDTSTNPGFHLPGADHGTSVESLTPANLGLGQVVPFLLEFQMDGTCVDECMTYVAVWDTSTTSGDDFGFDPFHGVLAAFIDAGDPFHVDPDGDAIVDNFSWTINTSGEIEGTFEVCGIDPGDDLVVEMWVVLDSELPGGGLGGTVQNELVSAETSGAGSGVCSPGDAIQTGNQTVPLKELNKFTNTIADLSISKEDNLDPVPINSTFTYTVVATNTSTDFVAN